MFHFWPFWFFWPFHGLLTLILIIVLLLVLFRHRPAPYAYPAGTPHPLPGPACDLAATHTGTIRGLGDSGDSLRSRRDSTR